MTDTKKRHSAAFKARVALEAVSWQFRGHHTQFGGLSGYAKVSGEGKRDRRGKKCQRDGLADLATMAFRIW